jgi:hypothetical protein
LAEREVVRRFELLVFERSHGVVAVRKQRRPQRLAECRQDEADADQRAQDAIAQPLRNQQREAEHGIDEQNVARPQQHRVNEADDKQECEPAQVDLHRSRWPRRSAEARGARRFGAAQALHLDREADPEGESEEEVELAGEQRVAQLGDDASTMRRRRFRRGNIEWLKPACS